MTLPTVIIDDRSDPGSWATAIAHTPHLARQVETEPDALRVDPQENEHVPD